MNPINLVTDGYDRKARLYPALLLVAPVIVVGVAILSAKLPALESFTAALLGFGGAFLLTQLARDEGKRKEKDLFAKWGGMPSVSIFRHRDTRLDAITKARYHKKLAGLVKEAKAPTIDQEKADPATADAIYTAWSNYLRVHTHDTKRFSLLFQENVNYGYRRNVWGLRPFGIAVSLLSCLACAVCLYAGYKSIGKFDTVLMGAGIFATILLLLWLFRFTSDWVRVPADTYAERLAECAETLGTKSTAARNNGKK